MTTTLGTNGSHQPVATVSILSGNMTKRWVYPEGWVIYLKRTDITEWLRHREWGGGVCGGG